jgi:hypothetical protein
MILLCVHYLTCQVRGQVGRYWCAEYYGFRIDMGLN